MCYRQPYSQALTAHIGLSFYGLIRWIVPIWNGVEYDIISEENLFTNGSNEFSNYCKHNSLPEFH